MSITEGVPVPLGQVLLILQNNFSVLDFAELGLIIVLILCSALLSGSESAFFSLKHTDIQELQDRKSSFATPVLFLHERPKRLLATILIANTAVNIMIAILATTLLNRIDFGGNELLKQFVDVVMITFTLVLLGEVVPKVYASHHNKKFAAFMAYPLVFLARIFYPISFVLTRTSSIIERRMLKHTHNVSLEDIKDAIEITSSDETSQEEKKILKGVINFGNIYVKQIMTSRLDVVAHDVHTSFDQLIKSINENRYSRLPVYNGSFDKIVGILYIKDLIPYLNEGPGFDWQRLVREPYFVPDTKKIDLLLQEFKKKKVHLAVVVDEYGGANGIVTMEDILEEIVGDINDEFDDDEVFYSRLDDENFVFDGKTSLTDVIRVMDLDDEVFERVRGEAESIGGLMIEMAGKIPAPGEKLQYDHFRFTIEVSDKRRVRRVKVSKLNETPVAHS